MTNSSNLKKVVGYKVLHFMHNEDQEAPWLQNPWHKDTRAFFRENKILGHFLHMFSMYDDL